VQERRKPPTPGQQAADPRLLKMRRDTMPGVTLILSPRRYRQALPVLADIRRRRAALLVQIQEFCQRDAADVSAEELRGTLAALRDQLRSVLQTEDRFLRGYAHPRQRRHCQEHVRIEQELDAAQGALGQADAELASLLPHAFDAFLIHQALADHPDFDQLQLRQGREPGSTAPSQWLVACGPHI